MAVFGSQVTVIERGNHIMGREDRDAAAIVHKQMERDGVHFMLNTTINEFTPNTDGKVAAHTTQNGIKVRLTVTPPVKHQVKHEVWDIPDAYLASAGTGSNQAQSDLDACCEAFTCFTSAVQCCASSEVEHVHLSCITDQLLSTNSCSLSWHIHLVCS